MNSRNDPCWCGSGKKWKKCHWPQSNPSLTFEEKAKQYKSQYGILLKTPKEIEGIKAACKLNSELLATVCDATLAGVTTNELDQIAVNFLKKAGAKSPCLHYGSPPFPKSICTSLNEVICHGIPNDIPLKNGDIVNIDVSCVYNGYIGDCSAMVAIGSISPEKQKVIDVSYETLMRAIKILKPGVLISEIGKTIEDYASNQGCSVVDQFTGHGVGIKFHEPPQVPHHYNDLIIPLEEGMTFTIEPMINAGVREGYIDDKDGWTAYTVDKKPSAQWEHTLLITKDGCEILTKIPTAALST